MEPAHVSKLFDLLHTVFELLESVPSGLALCVSAAHGVVYAKPSHLFEVCPRFAFESFGYGFCSCFRVANQLAFFLGQWHIQVLELVEQVVGGLDHVLDDFRCFNIVGGLAYVIDMDGQSDGGVLSRVF